MLRYLTRISKMSKNIYHKNFLRIFKKCYEAALISFLKMSHEVYWCLPQRVVFLRCSNMRITKTGLAGFLSKSDNINILIIIIAYEHRSIFLNSFLVPCDFRDAIFLWLVHWWTKPMPVHTDNHFGCQNSCLAPLLSISQNLQWLCTCQNC